MNSVLIAWSNVPMLSIGPWMMLDLSQVAFGEAEKVCAVVGGPLR